MSKYGNYTMRYDELGNPISYKGYSMVWTKGRQLAALSDTQTTMAFKYDSNGIRTLKRVNGVDTEFTYAGTTLVSQKTGNEIINFAYTAGGAPYGFTYNGTNYFYLLNLQGDIIGIYDSNGDVVVKYAYDAWGQLMSITGTLADTIGVKNPLRYRGYYYDTETKLYYLQSRYYDPETCHFISMDSYFVAGDYINGMNMYAYCLNNPVMYSDHSGYASEDSNSGWGELVSVILELIVFDKISQDFGYSNGFGVLNEAIGTIQDFEASFYEFTITEELATLLEFPIEFGVSFVVDIILVYIIGDASVSQTISTMMATALNSLFVYLFNTNNVIDPGQYRLYHYSFLELRDEWPIGQFYVHDFFFLYYKSLEKDISGNPIDEDFSPIGFKYYFTKM